jgi:hypothetical protein
MAIQLTTVHFKILKNAITESKFKKYRNNRIILPKKSTSPIIQTNERMSLSTKWQLIPDFLIHKDFLSQIKTHCKTLLPLGKMLTDAVKMIAYRAETAPAALVRRYLKNHDEARALMRQLFVSAGDIDPDEVTNTLTIRIHHTANPLQDKAIAQLLNALTQLDFRHPKTGAKMIYVLV